MSVNGNLANSLSRVGLEGKGSGEKFIPKEALLSDIDYRKKLLAGLIDTDGYFNKKSNSFSIITKSERLAKDIYGLVRSLGGRGSIKEKIKRIKEINFEGTYFEVYFYLGNLKLPTKLKRKGGYTSMFYISANRCSIDVKNTNRKEYVYGFLINSKSHWYITNDYIITHNSGKSLFTIQQAAYIDPTILDDENGKILPRICFSVDEFLDAVRNTKSTKNKTKCVIFDEAFRGMSSKASLSGTNKKIVEALMEVRQNNLVVFIVSPSFYLLELYPAVLRSKALFHIVKEKGTRLRYVRIFNFEKKAKLYQIGVRKAWSYPIKTKTKVRFFNKYPGGDEFEKKYRAKKRKALTSSEDKQSKIHKWKAQRNAAIKILYDTGKSYKEISNLMEEKGNRIGITQIGSIVSEEY
jgi:hypothetical protein